MNEIVHTLTDSVMRHLVVGSVAALVLVLSALVFLKAARIRTPVYRHVVWLYCLVGIVGLPLIWLYGPKLTLAVLPARAQTHAALTSPAVEPDREVPLGDAGLTPARPLPAETPATVLSWKAAAAALWFLGFSIMVTRLAVGWLRLRRICRGAVPLEGSEYPADWASPSLRLCRTSQLPGPVCFGMFRPVILLPQDMVRGGSRENLRMVLTHELAHVERRDCWANLFQRLVEVPYFFHPLVWLASRQLTQEREEICDNHVLAEGVSPDDYTTLLSHLGTQAVHTPYLQTVALFEGQLLARIRSLLDPARSHQTKLPWRVAALGTVAVLAGFLVFGSVRLAAQPSDRATPASLKSPASTSASAEQEPTSSFSRAAADGEKPEQPRFAARTFNSKAAFEVFVQETSGEDPRSIGFTPSAAPLEIPACYVWWVQLSAPVRDWDLLVREISENKVPGLRLLPAVDADLRHLAGLIQLRYLDLTRTQITDAGLAHLRALDGLEDLRLYAAHKVTDAGLEHLKGLTRLQRLSLTGTRITDAGLERLKGLAELRHLDLVYARITDTGVAHLKGLSQLQNLRLSGTPITDEGLEHLKGLTGLRALSLYRTRITSAGMKYLEGMKELKKLELHETAITDAGLEHLKGLTRLEELNLMDTQITDAGLVHLQSLAGLRHLWLSTPGITDAGLARLEGLTRLQDLSLESMQITDAGLAHLKGLTTLRGLWMSAPQVTDVGLAYLAAMPGVRWRSLGLDNTQITNAGLRHIEGMRELESLHLDGTQIGDAGLEHLMGLTGMQRLYLSNTRITDAGLECLKGLTGLQELDLSKTKISGSGLVHLKDIAGLKELRLDDTRTTDLGLTYLKALIRLQALWLDRTPITDAGLANLNGLTGLELLRLKETNVTDAGIQQIQQGLPKSTIVR